MTAAVSPERPHWTVGDEIRKARRYAGLEQAELAIAIGVSSSTISNWENDKGEPSVTHFRKIAVTTRAPWLAGVLGWVAGESNPEPADLGVFESTVAQRNSRAASSAAAA